MQYDLTVLAQEALSERPITKEKLLALVPKSNEFYPLAEMFATFMCESDRKNTILMQNREYGRTVSRKSIRNILLEYPEYLHGFTDEDDKVSYLGRPVDSKGVVAIRLAQEIEDRFFQSKEIETPVLITAIRAALIYKNNKLNNVIPEIDLKIAFDDYISSAKTKKRTRMPLKEMLNLFSVFHRKVVVRALESCTTLILVKDEKGNGSFIHSII